MLRTVYLLQDFALIYLFWYKQRKGMMTWVCSNNSLEKWEKYTRRLQLCEDRNCVCQPFNHKLCNLQKMHNYTLCDTIKCGTFCVQCADDKNVSSTLESGQNATPYIRHVFNKNCPYDFLVFREVWPTVMKEYLEVEVNAKQTNNMSHN